MEGFLGIGGNELFIILLFAFLIFGPDKLPEIARTVGRAIAKFRDAQNEVNEVIRQEVYDPATDKDNPLQKAAEKAAELNKKEPPKTETFAERKARYDKIRAERKAKEEAAAQAAREKAAAQDGAPGGVQSASATPAADPEPDIDELLGVAGPQADKSRPRAAKTSADGADGARGGDA